MLPESQPYWQKQTAKEPRYPDVRWNLPERATGSLSVVGGSSHGFQAVVRAGEFASANLPLAHVQLVLPSSLEKILANAGAAGSAMGGKNATDNGSATNSRNATGGKNVASSRSTASSKNVASSRSTASSKNAANGKLAPQLLFVPATPAGTLAKSSTLTQQNADAVLLIGDLSKNAETAEAVSALCRAYAGPLVVARDSLDLLTTNASSLVMRPHTTLVTSLAQLQKLFRALYYPKMLLLTAPLMSVVEALHKFTLSYPVTLLTLHEGQILTVAGGEVISTPLGDTDYSPLGLWNGELATRVAAYQIFCPEQELAATTAAILA